MYHISAKSTEMFSMSQSGIVVSNTFFFFVWYAHAPFACGSSRQAASLYERAVNIEETPERHVFLGEALVLAERKSEALWHYGRAADLYDDREYKVGRPARYGITVAGSP